MTPCTKCNLPQSIVKFVNINSTLLFIEMLDKLITYIVCWYNTLYLVSQLPVVWTNHITTFPLSRLVVTLAHTTCSTWYNVLYQHILYVLGMHVFLHFLRFIVSASKNLSSDRIYIMFLWKSSVLFSHGMPIYVYPFKSWIYNKIYLHHCLYILKSNTHIHGFKCKNTSNISMDIHVQTKEIFQR